jgi:hypothetical protein
MRKIMRFFFSDGSFFTNPQRAYHYLWDRIEYANHKQDYITALYYFELEKEFMECLRRNHAQKNSSECM